VVLLTHICETFDLVPWMQWGAEHSAGHYLDFVSAVLGLTFFPIGYLSHALKSDAPNRFYVRHNWQGEYRVTKATLIVSG
jgi:hypothetical protein